MKAWVEAATTDPDIILNWFTGMYSKCGVGLAMGRQPDGRFVFALDVDEHDPAHSGSETLRDLIAVYGPLPDTWRSITGSGGLHLLFTVPPGVEVRNGIAGDGLDVRGEGGQIVVHPSIHPATGIQYEWEEGCGPGDLPIAEAPEWLIELVRLPDTPPSLPQTVSSPAPTFSDPDTPSEWLRAKWDWPLQLRDAGWTEHHVVGDDVFWTRPGKDARLGESAVLHLPHGPFIIWSLAPELDVLRSVGRSNRDGSVSVTPFEFYAAQRHRGDLSAAARAIRALMEPDRRLSVTDPDPSTPGESRLNRYLGQALSWSSFWSDDNVGEQWLAEPVFPAGRLTALYAQAKQGKSEITLAVVAAVASGRPILGQPNHAGPVDVMYLDYEMTIADLQERLEALGYTPNDDLSHLHYFLLPSLPALDTAEGAETLAAMATELGVKAVVIDTMGRAVEGEENSNDTYRLFARHTGLTLKSLGLTVIRTDHAGKDRERGQRGASAKNDDADLVWRVDRSEDGWKMSRTHTRSGWVPETVLIDRIERADGTLDIRINHGSASYLPGTAEYVRDLKAAGVQFDPKVTVRQLTAAAKAVGLSRSSKMVSSALKWMRAEQPQFDTVSHVTAAADRQLSEPDDEEAVVVIDTSLPPTQWK
jgi:hypothetical protein